MVVPDSLEVGGAGARPAGGDQQVAAVLDVEGQQPGIIGLPAEADDALIGGKPGIFVFPEAQRETVKEFPVIRKVL